MILQFDMSRNLGIEILTTGDRNEENWKKKKSDQCKLKIRKGKLCQFDQQKALSSWHG